VTYSGKQFSRLFLPVTSSSHKEIILKETAATSAQASKFFFHGPIMRIKLLYLVLCVSLCIQESFVPSPIVITIDGEEVREPVTDFNPTNHVCFSLYINVIKDHTMLHLPDNILYRKQF
jgi:hypothetical protein